MDDSYSIFLTIVAASAAGFLILAKWVLANRGLNAIPTVGPSYPLSSYFARMKRVQEEHEVLEEGYEKYKSSPGIFKMRTMHGWKVVAAGKQYIDEVRRAPDDTLDFLAAVDRTMHIRYTLGPEMQQRQYHIDVIKNKLTRNVNGLFDIIRDELVHAFTDIIPVKDDGAWVKVNAMHAIQQIVCRTSNRIFVGLPVCRNEDYIKLNIQFTIDVADDGRFISLFPSIFQPIVGNWLTKVPSQVRRGMRHLRPIIEERMRMMAEYGDSWEDRPNDMLQWLMDAAHEEEKKSVRLLTMRILNVNFAAIHTSSLSMIKVLHYLAANPQYQQILRDEVESVISSDGWTKLAMGKMWKIDSFIKEVQRMNGLGSTTMSRLTVKPFTFSNGLSVPKGYIISCVMHEMHHDEENYSDPDVFDPWRFSNLRKDEDESLKHQFVATSLEFLNFGHGKHACPGRFFASNELKGMLAHIVLTYDVKFEKDADVPRGRFVGEAYIPEFKSVLFRKRS